MKSKHNPFHRISALASLYPKFTRVWGIGLALAATAPIAMAATNSWTGTGTNVLWSNVANWSLGTVPVIGDDVTVGPTYTSGTPLTLSGTCPMNSLSIDTGTTGSRKDLNGGTLQIASSSITVSGTKGTQISGGINLGDGSANTYALWTTSSTLQFLTANIQVNGGTGSDATIATSGTGGGVSFWGTNQTYAGAWSFGTGVWTYVSNALGTGAVTFASGTTWSNFFAGSTTYSNNITYLGNLFFSNVGNLNLTGIQTASAPGLLFFNYDGGGSTPSATIHLASASPSSFTNEGFVTLGNVQLDTTRQLNGVTSIQVSRGGYGGTLNWNVAETIGSGTAFSNRNAVGGGGNIKTYATLGMLTTGTTTIQGQYKLNNSATTTDGADLYLNAVSGGTLVLSGQVTDAASTTAHALTKIGDGTVTLSNSTNNYRGATTVNAGTLSVTNSSGSATGTGTVTVGGSSALGTPTLTGTGTVTGAVTISAASGGAAGTVNPGTVGGVGTLNVGATTISGTYACDINGATSDLLACNGALTLSGATLAITAVSPTASSYTIATYTGTAPAFTTVTGLPGGYTVDYSTSGVIKVSAPTTHSISGTVTLGGSGQSGVTVSDGAGHTATTNGSGVYTITSVPDGTYTVTPSLTGYTYTPASLSVTLSGADVTGKDFAVANAYGNWATINGLSGANALPTANPSNDGLNNLVKYSLGLNPAVSAQPPGTLSGSTLTFNKGTMASGDSNIAYSIEESTDMVTWTTPTGTPPSGTMVNGSSTITYTFPSGQSKVFARLQVIQTP